MNTQSLREKRPLYELMLYEPAIRGWFRLTAARILLDAGARLDIPNAEIKRIRDFIQIKSDPRLNTVLA